MGELHWRPARRPERAPLDGDSVRLEPLSVERHAEDLFASTEGAGETWLYLPYGPFVGKDEFMQWLRERAALDDPLAFAIIDRAAGAARGIATLMSIEPEHGSIEIGHIWLSPQLQRTRQATEAIYLMARHSFDGLGNRRLEWKCNAENAPSRRAAERFGFTFEGVFRQHRVIKGRNRDTAWYSITDGEWPLVRAAFEAWLAPQNFDSGGRQMRSLADIRAALKLEGFDVSESDLFRLLRRAGLVATRRHRPIRQPGEYANDGSVVPDIADVRELSLEDGRQFPTKVAGLFLFLPLLLDLDLREEGQHVLAVPAKALGAGVDARGQREQRERKQDEEAPQPVTSVPRDHRQADGAGPSPCGPPFVSSHWPFHWVPL